MSAETAGAFPAPTAIDLQRRKGLRVALAVAVGFTFLTATGAIIPFLAPLFAVQLLLTGSRPLSPAKGLGMIAMIVVVGTFLFFLARLTGDRPFVFLILLGLFFFACFFAQASGKGGPAITLIVTLAVMVPMLTVADPNLAGAMLSVLVKGAVGGIVLVWLAYALIPPAAGSPDDLQQKPVAAADPHRRALADMAIVITIIGFCLASESLSTALVIPITVASVLAQFNPASSWRSAIGLLVVNLLGGVIASFAFEVLQLRPVLPFLFAIVLFVGLWLGGRAASAAPSGAVYAGALIIFLILFGLGVSPLPGSSAETFATRITYVAGAVFYAFMAAALLRPATAQRRP